MTQRRQVGPHFIRFLLGHFAEPLRSVRPPPNFCAQLVAKAPSAELSEALAAAFERADMLLRAGTGTLAARLHEAAISRILIATMQLRLRDLIALDLALHFERDGEGLIRRIHLSPREASSPIGIDIPLHEHLSKAMERHLRTFRPLLPGADRTTRLLIGSSERGMTMRELRAHLRLLGL